MESETARKWFYKEDFRFYIQDVCWSSSLTPPVWIVEHKSTHGSFVFFKAVYSSTIETGKEEIEKMIDCWILEAL